MTTMAKPSRQISESFFHPFLVSLTVWGTWTLMLAAALVYVAKYGSNVPSWDDWDMVPMMTGEQPVTAAWLWSQHNEHRIPVPRLLMLALYRLFGCDFRVGMYFNVLSMGALALGMIWAAKNLRGGLSFWDAFFPVLLLNWGQGLNFIWGWQVEFFLSTLLAGVLLLLIVRSGTRLRLGTAVATGICLLLLVGCGAHGVVLVPALAFWLGHSGVVCCRSPEVHAKRDGLVILGITGMALVLVILYLVGYQWVPHHPFTPSLLDTMVTSTQFLTMSFGPAIQALWPFSGWLALCLLLFAVAVLIVVGRNHPAEHHRALGLLLFLAAMASLALALGLGRPETFVKGFEPRYITLSVPSFCCVYFACEFYATPRMSQVVRGSLLALSCAAFWPATAFGVAYATDVRSQLAAFERDLAAGMPSYRLIHRYGAYLHLHPEVLTDYMPMLRRAGIGCFTRLQDDPAFREISVPLVPKTLNQVKWKAKTAQVSDHSSYLVFDFPERYVCGIRLKFMHANPQGMPPCVLLYWKSAGQADFPIGQSRKHSPTGDRATWDRITMVRRAEPETTLTLWVCDRVSQLRIHPDRKPGAFTISEIVLLVTAGESFASVPAATTHANPMPPSVRSDGRSASDCITSSTVSLRARTYARIFSLGLYPCPGRWHVP
jgi:hypothetical protein